MTRFVAILVVTVAACARPPASETSIDTMKERCRKEIIELHQFFEDWFNGKLENTAAAFARFDSVMADSFAIVAPSGHLSPLGPLIERLKKAHGSHAGGACRIWIENTEARFGADGLCLVTYEEWQDLNGAVKGRLSSALFRQREGTPNGVEWLHVHEVWLPEK